MIGCLLGCMCLLLTCFICLFFLTIDGSNYFTIALYHKGYFSSMHLIHYMQGEIDSFNLCESDRMSLIELRTIAVMLGHDNGFIEFYWKQPGSTLAPDFSLIKNKVNVMEICNNVPRNRYISTYISVITISRHDLDDHKNQMDGVATDLFCTGVIGHSRYVLKLEIEIPNLR